MEDEINEEQLAEQENQELQWANQLEQQRNESIQELRELERLNDKLKPPSKFKYLIAYFLSILGDLCDLLELTIIGTAFTAILDIFLTLLLAGFGAAANKSIKEIKKIHDYASLTKDKAIEKLSIKAVKNEMKELKSGIKELGKSLSDLGKKNLNTKNPMWKTLGASLLDFIPLIELLPWRTLNVRMVQSQEKKAYQETKQDIFDSVELIKEQLAQME